MNAKKKISEFFLVISCLLSCATPAPKRDLSEWTELDRAAPMACSQWPIRESDIDVASISATSAGNGGFVATMRLRSGSEMPVFAETHGNESVLADNLKPFPIGRDAHVIAVGVWKKEPVAFVIQNKNDRGWLEVRAIRDNRMVSRMATPFSDEATAGKIIQSGKGWWLQVNHSESQSSFVFVNPENAAKWNFFISGFQSEARFSTIVGNGRDNFVYAVERVKGGDENKSQFAIIRLEDSGKFNEVGKLSVPTKGGLESWSAVMLDKRIVLSIVRGDSMVGQGVLGVAGVNVAESAVTMAWSQDFPYPDVHLGESSWLSNGSSALLGIMRWIDAEASFSRIRVDATGAGMIGDAGIFPKGTVLVTGYLNDSSKGLGAFRFRDKELWKYKLCKMSLK